MPHASYTFTATDSSKGHGALLDERGRAVPFAYCAVPQFVGCYYVGDYAFAFRVKPLRWHRVWMRIAFGIRWQDYVEAAR